MSESYQMYAIVQADSAQQLTDQLNEQLYKLRHKHPVVTFEGLIARICYEETEFDPEPKEEEKPINIELTCQDCPYFIPQLKADGTIDQRSRVGGCPFTKYKKAYRDGKLCDKLLNNINDGEVKLCVVD